MAWGLAILALYAQGRPAFAVVGFGIMDLVLGTFFSTPFTPLAGSPPNRHGRSLLNLALLPSHTFLP